MLKINTLTLRTYYSRKEYLPECLRTDWLIIWANTKESDFCKVEPETEVGPIKNLETPFITLDWCVVDFFRQNPQGIRVQQWKNLNTSTGLTLFKFILHEDY